MGRLSAGRIRRNHRENAESHSHSVDEEERRGRSDENADMNRCWLDLSLHGLPKRTLGTFIRTRKIDVSRPRAARRKFTHRPRRKSRPRFVKQEALDRCRTIVNSVLVGQKTLIEAKAQAQLGRNRYCRLLHYAYMCHFLTLDCRRTGPS